MCLDALQVALEQRETQAGQGSLVRVVDQVHLVTLVGQAPVGCQDLMDDQVIRVHLEEMAFQEHQVINIDKINCFYCMHTLI